MSVNGETSGTGATSGKDEMSELCRYRSSGKRSFLQFALLSRVLLAPCLLLVAHVSLLPLFTRGLATRA
jgi:hypothetical protein